MHASTKLNKRDFDSYFQEYLLMSTETEINAYWQRMDALMERLTEEERKVFFEQLLASVEKDLGEIREIKAKLLESKKEFSAERQRG